MSLSEFHDDATSWLRALRTARSGVSPEPEVAPTTTHTAALSSWRAALARGRACMPFAATPAAGQLWTAQAGTEDGPRCLVLLTAIAPGLRGLATWDRAWIAATDDVLIPGDANPTGVMLAASLWKPLALTTDMLDILLGSVRRDVLDAVEMLLDHQTKRTYARQPLGLVERHSIKGAEEAALRLLRWEITAPNGKRCAYLTGPRIVQDDDPRLEVREELTQMLRTLEAHALSAPATEEVGAPSLVERAFAGLRAAFEQLGAAVSTQVATEPAAVIARSTSASSPPAAGEAFEAVVRLGAIEVGIEVLAADELFVSAVAYLPSTDAPVPDVSLIIRVQPEDNEDEASEVRRVTDREGVIHVVQLPLTEGSRYAIVLQHGEDSATFSWQ